MTPKEKAEDLVDKYKRSLKPIIADDNSKYFVSQIRYIAAIQCALISVDEILSYDLNAKCESQFEIEKRLENYWKEVKNELIKL